MYAIAISGSPRPKGNTETLCRRVLDGLASAGCRTALHSLAGRAIAGCTGCAWCRKDGHQGCVQEDDFQALYAELVLADIVVIASPVYFGSATPELMAFLDRAGYVSRGDGQRLARKVGAPIAVARRAGHNFTVAQLLMWLVINDFVVPGSSYWPIAFGGAPGTVEDDAEGLATIDRLAANLAWVAGKLTA